MPDTRSTPDEIRDYYDSMLVERMLDYRIRRNRRIELAADYLVSMVQPGMRVLDVGCGIGVVTERIARRAAPGSTLGIDISPQIIRYAQRTSRAENLAYRVADVLSADGENMLRQHAPFDIISLIDVVEHIPSPRVEGFLILLAGLLRPQGRLCLTFPTPSYQRYLREHEPSKLQPVDEDIRLAMLERAAASVGMVIEAYTVHDVWRTQQYAHCTLTFERQMKLGSSPSAIERSRNWVSRNFVQPYRRWRYGRRIVERE